MRLNLKKQGQVGHRIATYWLINTRYLLLEDIYERYNSTYWSQKRQKTIGYGHIFRQHEIDLELKYLFLQRHVIQN